MTREEAIKIIEVVFKSKEAYKHNDSVTHQALNMAIEALSAEAYFTDGNKIADWIPCSERLPEVDVKVLTTTDWSDVLIAWLGKDGAWETEELILANDEILAWMPLPTPYKGGDSECV